MTLITQTKMIGFIFKNCLSLSYNQLALFFYRKLLTGGVTWRMKP